MIICYSKSFVTQNAMTYYSHEKGVRNVYCFNDRVKFLTCVTLLNDSLIVLDTIESPPDDVRWLHNKLSSRFYEGEIFYLAKPQTFKNVYCIYLNTITSFNDMDKIIHLSLKKWGVQEVVTLQTKLISRIQGTLSASYRELLKYEALGSMGREKYISRHGHKSYLNRRYHMNKKLRLETVQEYSSMIILLNDKL